MPHIYSFMSIDIQMPRTMIHEKLTFERMNGRSVRQGIIKSIENLNYRNGVRHVVLNLHTKGDLDKIVL